jgi:type IV pilus assembly protein PilW
MKKPHSKWQSGLTLIELMISMAIGMILMLGAAGVLITNQRSFVATEDIVETQDNARVAVDMLSRDIRESGSHPCGSVIVMNEAGAAGNELTDSWNNPIAVFEKPNNPPNNPAIRIAGTGAILLTKAGIANPINNFVLGTDTITVNGVIDELDGGDLVMVCNHERGLVFTASAVAGQVITLNPKPEYDLRNGVLISLTQSNLWFIGNNGRATGSGRSLYRVTNGGNPEEMVEGVGNLAVETAVADPAGEPLALHLGFTVCGKRQPDIDAALIPDTTESCGNMIERTANAIVQRRARG